MLVVAAVAGVGSSRPGRASRYLSHGQLDSPPGVSRAIGRLALRLTVAIAATAAALLASAAQARADIGFSTDDSMPTWSPNGERVAFVHLEPGGYSLYVANADRTSPHRLIDAVNEESEVPSWSPDGTRVAIDMGGAIGVANVLTGDASVVPHIRWANHPAWSPASDEIAYVNENDDVWGATARGTNKRRISTRAGADTFMSLVARRSGGRLRREKT